MAQRSISDVRDMGDDTLMIEFRNIKGNVTREVFRIDDFALISLIEVARNLAGRRLPPMYYQGRMYIVFHARSHPFTYVYIFPDMHDSGKIVARSYRRNA